MANLDVSDREIPRVELQVANSAFGRRIRQFELVNHGYKHTEDFLHNSFTYYEPQINEAVLDFDMIKTVSYFSAEFERSVEKVGQSDPILEKRDIHIPTVMRSIYVNTDIPEHFQSDIVDHVMRKIDEVMVEGSGFTLSRIIRLSVQIFQYEPLRGSGFIELPKVLKNKRAIINLKNTDDECFKWSILAALHYDEVRAKNKNKANDAKSYSRWMDELNFNGIDFPVRLNQIKKFMHQNQQIAVNVYYFDSDKKRVCPLFLTSNGDGKQFVHLLLLTSATNENVRDDCILNRHYCWIKNLNSLVGAQLNNHQHKVSICSQCLIHFNSEEKLEKHSELCYENRNTGNCAIEMPSEEEKYVTFKNFRSQLKVPFIIYADTEALLKPPEKPIFSVNCSTAALQEHEIHSIGYYFKHESNESSSRYASFRGKNCLDWFMNELREIANEAFDFLADRLPMNVLSKEEEKAFYKATFCHICKKDFKESDIPVRDHCHLTGDYRGAAHQSCNLNYQISRTIPVVMHNLSGYDLHLLIRKLGDKDHLPGDIKIIPRNSEKYISVIKSLPNYDKNYVTQIKFKFIDSLRFMSESLDKLAKLVTPDKKRILKSECIKLGYSDEMFSLLIRKCEFPYEYVDSFEKLEVTTMPTKDRFYSSLTDSNISDENYCHAQKVWTTFGICTLGEYSDLYLKIDVLLLADVFENFRNTCLATYSLDPAHYFGAPGLSFDAMLKYTNVSIELFTDADMLLFAEHGIRGGVSQINKRYVKANNIYMGEDYDQSKETSYLMYLDGKNMKYECISNILVIIFFTFLH